MKHAPKETPIQTPWRQYQHLRSLCGISQFWILNAVTKYKLWKGTNNLSSYEELDRKSTILWFQSLIIRPLTKRRDPITFRKTFTTESPWFNCMTSSFLSFSKERCIFVRSACTKTLWVWPNDFLILHTLLFIQGSLNVKTNPFGILCTWTMSLLLSVILPGKISFT